jgi:hypothetical protein
LFFPSGLPTLAGVAMFSGVQCKRTNYACAAGTCAPTGFRSRPNVKNKEQKFCNFKYVLLKQFQTLIHVKRKLSRSPASLWNYYVPISWTLSHMKMPVIIKRLAFYQYIFANQGF